MLLILKSLSAGFGSFSEGFAQKCKHRKIQKTDRDSYNQKNSGDQIAYLFSSNLGYELSVLSPCEKINL